MTTVVQDSEYHFTPTSSDADDDVLTFSATHVPAWATFDAATGELTGTPGAGDVGSYTDIEIAVSDGEHTASLGPFSIDVVAMGDGSATLSWTPPTERTDGTPLTDLAGYKIYWGTSPGSYPNSVKLDSPGLATYVVEGLTPATWYFVATAFDSNGVESAFSNPASKTID